MRFVLQSAPYGIQAAILRNYRCRKNVNSSERESTKNEGGKTDLDFAIACSAVTTAYFLDRTLYTLRNVTASFFLIFVAPARRYCDQASLLVRLFVNELVISPEVQVRFS